MHSALTLLDKALELGRQELAHLAAGDVDKAEALAFGRDSILNEALTEENLSAPAPKSVDELLSRLTQLKDLQARIIDEAGRLHRTLGDQVRRADQEQKRHAGYGRNTRPTPRIQSRFISQNG
ncbi:hypothetical protein [Humidesulfovibrio sp.]